MKSDKLIFREEDHTYWLDGKRLIGVSEAIQAGGLKDFSRIAPDVLEHARQRGVAVHTACQFLDENDLDWSTVSSEIEPYVRAWERFKTDTCLEIVECETKHYHETHGFAGTLDRIVKIGGDYGIVDIKTYRPNAVTGVQLSAYWIMQEDVRFKRWGLWLKNDGKYSIKEYTNTDWDCQVFLSCLTIAKFKGVSK